VLCSILARTLRQVGRQDCQHNFTREDSREGHGFSRAVRNKKKIQAPHGRANLCAQRSSIPQWRQTTEAQLLS
jgi:hypothetical protein